MKLKISLFLLFITFIGFSQSGINYKAVVNDANGTVLASSPVSIQFIIYEGVALTNNVYQESHTTNTDANGLVIVTIGEGITGDDFNSINWSNDEHFLNVQVNVGFGLVDMGTTIFNSVPYSIHAEVATLALNVSGLEQIDEGNGPGWRLIGNDSSTHGNIGLNAVDMTTNLSSGNYGATGQNSVAFGTRTSASGGASASFGVETTASANNSVAFGQSTTATAFASTAMGQSTTASGQNSTAMGLNTNANSYVSTAIGRYNVGGGNPSSWVGGDAIFEIGNGTSNANRNNVLTVTKEGLHIIESSDIGLIIDAVNTGLFILNPEDGIIVSNASDYGALIGGATAGVLAGSTVEANPDIILEGSDGIIASDNTSSADMFLRSNDAVVVELDYDNNEGGNFRVRNGTGANVFDVNESGVVRVNGTVIHSSDRRLKKDIEELSYGLNEVLQLRPKQYYWKNREQNKKSLGLIAQEVEPIISEVVKTQDDELQTLGVSYSELIPILIKAIQEQQSIINNQVSEIEKLSEGISQIHQLSQRINQLETNQKSLQK